MTAATTLSKGMPTQSSFDMVVARSQTGKFIEWPCRSVEIEKGKQAALDCSFRDLEGEGGTAMADVEADALARATLREIEKVLVFHDARTGLAVEAMGDDVTGAQDLQHFIIKSRWLADMHHHRNLEDLGDLLAELYRCRTPRAGDDVAGAHFDADDVLAVFSVAFKDAVKIDVADVPQFGDAVAGDETDRTEVQEGLGCARAMAR